MALTKARITSTNHNAMLSAGPGGYGLICRVRVGASGTTKKYLQRIQIDGRRTMVGLGDTRVISLNEARDAAYENWRAVRRGEPLPDGQGAGIRTGHVARVARAKVAAPTFSAVMAATLDAERAAWKPNASTARTWISQLAHAKPLADTPIDRIEVDDVKRILDRLTTAGKASTAVQLRVKLHKVFSRAIAEGFRTTNPADREVVAAVAAKSSRKREHHAAVPHERIGEVMGRIAALEDGNGRALALRFVTLTSARVSEVLGMEWSEIDREAAVWTVPASRSKTKEERYVPLARQALAVLDEAEAAHRPRGCRLVFPGRAGRPMGPQGVGQILRAALEGTGIAGTTHGMRSSFRMWAQDQRVDEELAEAALGHRVGSTTRQAYARSALIEPRREIAQRWADYATGN